MTYYCKGLTTVSMHSELVHIESIFADKNPLLPEIAKDLRNLALTSPGEISGRVDQILNYTEQNESAKFKISYEVNNLLRLDGLAQLLAESGISEKSSFWQELFSRVRHKILPRLKTENNFRFRLHRVFSFEQDYLWLKDISSEQLLRLYNIIVLSGEKDKEKITGAVHHAMLLVSHRIVTIGSDPAMGLRFHDLSEHQTLFMSMHNELITLVNELTSSGKISESRKNTTIAHIQSCRIHLLRVIEAADIEGADINKTFQIKKCQLLLDRLQIFISVFDSSGKVRIDSIRELASAVAEEEFTRSSLSRFMKENMRVISLRISDHKSKTGEHYIARDLRDYNRFLFAAIGAGFIVSVLVFVKAWMHQAHLPLFWEAMAYSFNYALGFVMIQLFRFTLATKQPAMTAASLAKSLDNKDGRINVREFVLTMARVSHTQAVSFIGNLLIVFPLPFFISWLLDVLMGYRLYDIGEAINVVEAQHPWKSGALWFAAITGIYLFISGIIAGYVDNRVIFSRIPERMRQHPGLRRLLGLKPLVNLSVFVEHEAGSLAGNITLGLFLGTATFIGSIIGLPFDIRHITFAAGSFTSALYCTDYVLPLSELIIVFIGILFIGLVNFSVSFGLAFLVACKSREISIRKNPELLSHLSTYFKRKPQDFLMAPRHMRTADEIFGPEKTSA